MGKVVLSRENLTKIVSEFQRPVQSPASILVPYFQKTCNKKQGNYAAILISCSVEAAKKAFRIFAILTPLSVN
jgi:hypothetical protein